MFLVAAIAYLHVITFYGPTILDFESISHLVFPNAEYREYNISKHSFAYSICCRQYRNTLKTKSF